MKNSKIVDKLKQLMVSSYIVDILIAINLTITFDSFNKMQSGELSYWIFLFFLLSTLIFILALLTNYKYVSKREARINSYKDEALSEALVNLKTLYKKKINISFFCALSIFCITLFLYSKALSNQKDPLKELNSNFNEYKLIDSLQNSKLQDSMDSLSETQQLLLNEILNDNLKCPKCSYK
jgi:hypothetical protein